MDEISPERRLCLAIFLRAVIDWLRISEEVKGMSGKRAYSKVRKRHLLAERKEIKKYFESDWCKMCIGGDRNFDVMLNDIMHGHSIDASDVEQKLRFITG